MIREYLVWYNGSAYVRYSGIDSRGKKEISKLYRGMRNMYKCYQEGPVLIFRLRNRKKEEVSLR
jgi:hypothetical protein